MWVRITLNMTSIKFNANETINYDYSFDGDKYKSLSIATASTKADSNMDNNKGASDNIKNKKIQSNTIESVMSLKVDDSKKKPNNFNLNCTMEMGTSILKICTNISII